MLSSLITDVVLTIEGEEMMWRGQSLVSIEDGQQWDILSCIHKKSELGSFQTPSWKNTSWTATELWPQSGKVRVFLELRYISKLMCWCHINKVTFVVSTVNSWVLCMLYAFSCLLCCSKGKIYNQGKLQLKTVVATSGTSVLVVVATVAYVTFPIRMLECQEVGVLMSLHRKLPNSHFSWMQCHSRTLGRVRTQGSVRHHHCNIHNHSK